MPRRRSPLARRVDLLSKDRPQVIRILRDDPVRDAEILAEVAELRDAGVSVLLFNAIDARL